MLGGRPCSAAGRGDGDVVAVTREGNLAGRFAHVPSHTNSLPPFGGQHDRPTADSATPTGDEPGAGPPAVSALSALCVPSAIQHLCDPRAGLWRDGVPPVGIYFGSKAKGQIAQTGERGVELATAGVVVGWIFTALYGVVFLAWCGMAAVMLGSAPGVQP